MKCPDAECSFVARPLQPATKSLGAEPKQAKNPTYCPLHKENLCWVKCSGGDPDSIRKKLEGPPPCTITTVDKFGEESGKKIIEVFHNGNHNHPRPSLTGDR